jgi:hypothetical protein
MPDLRHEPTTERSPRPRALAEIALDTSQQRGEQLARRWALAMIAARPFAEVGELPLADVVDQAPMLCVQMVLAVQSDTELDRLSGEGSAEGSRARDSVAPGLAAMVGAPNARAAVAAVEALRGVLWEALLEDVAPVYGERAGARLIADMADRLSFVCARLLGSAVESLQQAVAHGPAEEPAPHARVEPSGALSRAVIVDERSEDVSAVPERLAPTAAPRPVQHDERPLSWDESPPVPPGSASAEIEIRDERVDDGAAARIGSIARWLQRYASDRKPFAVMLLEPMDIELLRDLPGELARVDGELGQMLERTLGPAAVALPAALSETAPSYTRESPGRYWVLAPRGDASAAAALCERLVRGAGRISGVRGLPLELAFGTAMCPQDGREPSALAAHADVDLYAARSAARLASRGVGRG